MQALLHYLDEHRERLHLANRSALTRPLAMMIKTPRFRASRHVIFLIHEVGNRQPALVAKVARLPEDGEGIQREATILASLESLAGLPKQSVPQLIVHDTIDGFPFLVETAVGGEPIDRKRVAAAPERWCQAVLDWLRPLGATTDPVTNSCSLDEADWKRLVLEPLQRCHRILPWQAQQQVGWNLLFNQLAKVEPSSLRLVVEHGDLSHPNLIEYQAGRVGVIDWELANFTGIPLHDLMFFLLFVTVARCRSLSPDAQQRAFAEAFLGRNAWAWRWIHQYLDEHRIDRTLAKPLAAIAILRYLDVTLARLKTGSDAAEDQPLTGSLRDWFLDNRYLQFASQLLAGFAEGVSSSETPSVTATLR